jgi:hypothetical protein
MRSGEHLCHSTMDIDDTHHPREAVGAPVRTYGLNDVSRHWVRHGVASASLDDVNCGLDEDGDSALLVSVWGMKRFEWTYRVVSCCEVAFTAGAMSALFGSNPALSR